MYEIACIRVQSIVFMIMGSAASFWKCTKCEKSLHYFCQNHMHFEALKCIQYIPAVCERGGFTFKNIFPIWSFDISQLEIENPEFQSMIRSRERINKCILKQIFNPTSKNSISYFTAKCGLTPQQTFQWLLLLFWRYKKLDSISGGKQCHVWIVSECVLIFDTTKPSLQML